MKNIIQRIKKVIKNSSVQSLIVALTAMYLMFGVLNAGFIMVQVTMSLLEFFYTHLRIGM
jgi:membrane-bound ClpP family serine protease